MAANESGSISAILAAAAIEYIHREWSIIAIGPEKKPLGSWKQNQTARADEATIRAQLADPRAQGLAVILGPVSGGLSCRDFDEEAGYHRWAQAHPAEARGLPTARTARGYHVYFQCDGARTRKLEDGELRGEGGYVILPPSRHPSGKVYAWINEPNGNIPEIDPVAIGLASSIDRQSPLRDCRESREGRDTATTDPAIPTSPALPEKSPTTHPIPDACYVTGPGQHDAKTLALARFLKFTIGLRSFDDAAPWFEIWYEKGRRHMSDPEPDNAYTRLGDAFDRARVPPGASPADEAMQRVLSQPLPAEVARHSFYGDKMPKVAALCFHLSDIAGGAPFVLSSHQVAKLIGYTQRGAYDALHGVARKGLIECVDPGRPGHPGKNAARWRWIGGADNPIQ